MIKPDPPASLADTREAVERMDARGERVVPVDEAQVEAIVRDLVDSGVESLTVALINSYVNAATRSRSARSSSGSTRASRSRSPPHVLPEFREYERTLTACMNSYVRPEGRRLRRRACRAQLQRARRARPTSTSCAPTPG